MTPDPVPSMPLPTESSPGAARTPEPSAEPAQATLDHQGETAMLTAEVPARAGKYAIEGEIARGGMGMVLRARDPDLGRTLAVKVLLARHHHAEAATRRFLEEAQICGQLQHPGVPPVHEVGTLPDGRPFFAMKLVKGETLADLLDRRIHPIAELPRFLGIFEQVCQTVAYAHSRSVVHRDLKPANVMVGAFGEVQVMDWGLAKLLSQEVPAEIGETGQAGTSTFFTSRGASPLETQPGTVLGTPSFMPPEQARGQTTHLDARADVFSLGGILCVILTGRPPYTGKDMATVTRQAAEGNTVDAFARLDGCLADADLVTLAKTCLAFQPSQRPPDAGAVAVIVAKYRQGVEERLRQAEIANVKKREGIKARVLAFAVVLLGLGTIPALVGYIQRDVHNQDMQSGRVELKLEKVAQIQEEARKISLEDIASAEQALNLLRQANAVLAQAENIIETGGVRDFHTRKTAQVKQGIQQQEAVVQKALAQARKEIKFLTELRRAQEQRAIVFEGQSNTNDNTARVIQAFADLGKDVTVGPEGEAVAWLRTLPLRVREPALEALQEWSGLISPWQTRLARLVAAADDDPWRSRLRQALAAKDKKELQALAAEARERLLPPTGYIHLADGLCKCRLVDDAASVLRWGRLKHPQHLWLYYTQAQALGLVSPAQIEGIIGCYQAALAIQPQSALGYSNLGVAFFYAQHFDESIACLKQAVTLDPTYAFTHFLLARSLFEQGNFDEAFVAVCKAVERDPKLVSFFDQFVARLYQRGKVEEAQRWLRKGLEVAPRSAPLHNDLGWRLNLLDKYAEALPLMHQAVALDPKNPLYHNNLGRVLQNAGRLTEAIACYHEALKHDPKHKYALDNLGLTLQKQGKMEEAKAVYHRGVEANPKNADLLASYGWVHHCQGNYTEALSWLHKALALNPKDGFSLQCIGELYQKTGRFEDAAESYSQALQSNPQDCDLLVLTGSLHLARGNYSAAKEVLHKGLANPSFDFFVDRRKAEGWLRQCAVGDKLDAVLAGTAQPKDAAERLTLACLCGTKRHHVQAVKLARKAYATEPKLGENLASGDRNAVAASAVQAGFGQGQDAAKLTDAEKAELRNQSLTWLKADLVLLRKQLASANLEEQKEARKRLPVNLRDPDFAGVREEEKLKLLPEPERAAWQQHWDEVRALIEGK